MAGRKPTTPLVRFMEKVQKEHGPGGCWNWTASKFRNGYGCFNSKDTCLAHRWAYFRLTGPIPIGLEIDHLCSNRSCVNPLHLEAVTPAENRRRRTERQTHCIHGHPFDDENTYHWRGERYCKACRKERHTRDPRRASI